MSVAGTSYRVYCYDESQKVVTSEWLDAADDEAAIAEAEARGFATKCEIWEGNRLVAKLIEGERSGAIAGQRFAVPTDMPEGGIPA